MWSINDPRLTSSQKIDLFMKYGGDKITIASDKDEQPSIIEKLAQISEVSFQLKGDIFTIKRV